MSGTRMQFDVPNDRAERFADLKEDAHERIGTGDYMRHGEFLRMLMDVYEHHLEENPGPLLFDASEEAEGDAHFTNTSIEGAVRP